MKKRFTALFIAAVMILTLMPMMITTAVNDEDIINFRDFGVDDGALAEMVEDETIPADVIALDLSVNLITDISPLAELSELTWLNLEYNDVRDLSPLFELENLEYVSLLGNPITFAQVKELEAQLPDCEVRHDAVDIGNPDDPCECGNCIECGFSTELVDISYLDMTDEDFALLIEEEKILPETVTELNLSQNQITDISLLARFTNLKKLTLDFNEISDLKALAELTKLEELYLYQNKLVDISPLSGLVNLTKLTLSFNEIVDISPLAELTKLFELTLSWNKIVDVKPLSKLVNLDNLQLVDNEIKDVSPLAELVNLRELWLAYNPISEIMPLAKLTKLEKLTLYGALITLKQVEELKAAIPGCRIEQDVGSCYCSEHEYCEICDEPVIITTTPPTTVATTTPPPPRSLGDVDGDGIVTITDALEILKFLAGLPSILITDFTGDAMIAARITVGVSDNPKIGCVLEILKKLAGIPSLVK